MVPLSSTKAAKHKRVLPCSCLLVLVVLIVVGSFASNAPGQKHTENSKDQTLKGSGRVNPSTLAMEFELPLGSYPGRGINIPISLSYSSKVWRAEYIYTQPRLNNPGDCIAINMPKFADNSASGWTTSMAAPYVEYTGWDNIFSYPTGSPPTTGCPEGSPSYNNAIIKRITVHLPGGETHELRIDDSVHTYPTYGSPPAKDGTYLATDGSNIKYVENSTSGTYKLLMPDGSFYTLKPATQSYDFATIRKAERFTDRNGNFTTYNESGNTWTDTLGRTLPAPVGLTAPSVATDQLYQLPGMTGGYTFRWRHLNGGTQESSALTDIASPAYQLKYMADRATVNPNQSPRTSGYLFNSAWSAWLHDGGAPVFNPVVLSEIVLPTGQKYKFTYDIYGRIERIYYPTGGEERFAYGVVPPLGVSDLDNVSDQMNFGVVDRKVHPSAGQGAHYHWTYGAAYVAPQGYMVAINNPDGTRTERIVHQGHGPGVLYGFENVLAGMPYEERVYDNASPARLVSQKLTTWAKTAYGAVGRHPRIEREESRIYDNPGNGISATTTFEYEGDLNLTDTPVLMKRSSQYAFVSVGASLPANPVRVSESKFLINDTAYAGVKNYYTDQNMVGLVTASEVRDGAGTVVSRSEMVYDEAGRSPGYRGNPTTAKVWDSTKGVVTNPSAYISTSARFDTYGNQYEATDAKGNTTSTTFDSTYNAFPIQVTSPIPSDGVHGSNTAFVTTATFDPVTGLPLTTTDANGIETRIAYDPVTLRPLNTKTYFNNVQVGSTAETIYNDQSGNYWVKNRAQIDTNVWAEAITYFDGLGRAWKSEEINSKGNILVEKEFDAQGRVKRVSNPFRAGETKIWTTNVYDEASRIKEVILQDGATVKTDYGVSIAAPIGVTKQITDQANKRRKGISDALGRMIRVIEDPTGTPLSTDYVFDTLGNLRKTIQGEQNRFFMHDSLGRLLYAKQPEQDTRSAFVAIDPITSNTQWSVKYEYDDNGNVTKTTDARGVFVAGTYDALNRLKVRDYSDTTPDVSFYYDGKYPNAADVPQTATGSAKGKTTGVKSSVSRTNYTSFDNLGRLLAHQQITDGQTYGTSYTYNLSGGLTSETYPSGRTVNYDINADGDLSRIWGQKGSTVTTYANAVNYNASGAVEKMRLGNGKWETATYNNRLQITQIGLGTGSHDASLLKLEYGYGNNTLNNGNLREQKITVPNAGGTSGFTAIQTYAYDDLNRLQIAEEKVGTTTTWKQTFVIDRYGNREFDPNNTTTLGSCPQAVCNPNIGTARNRFTTTGYGYDANGNLTDDAEGREFLYDAENHQTRVKNDQDVTVGEYFYDGDGKRVKKISPTESTVFVYNASGALVAEYSTAIAAVPQTSYLTTDHLGSPRIVTNQLGTVTNRKDFTAFGEENFTAQRTAALGYTAPDNLRKGYTGYEKDDESGLDFAQARYYNSTHGRYTSVDPLTASASVRNPQTFNRYSYVLNSPYKFVDPLGLRPSDVGTASWGYCGAGYDSCEGDYFWGQANFVEPPPEPEQEETNEGVANNQKAAGGEQQQAEEPEPPPSPGVQNDPAWLIQLRAAFPGFSQTDSATVNEAITDAQNSVGPGSAYGTILIGQFRDSASSTTPQQALDDLVIGSIRITARNAQGDPENAEPVGSVFDGRNSTYSVDHDQNRGTPDVTVAQYFRDNPTVNAITHGQYIFLGAGFFSQDRDGRAKSMIHEGVVHRGFGRRDAAFDPDGRNRQREGSHEINRRIDLYYRRRAPRVVQ